MREYAVHAEWDPESASWWVRSEDVPGLAIGADTLEALVERLKDVVPELLRENDMLPKQRDGFELVISVTAERTERIRLPAAA